MTNRLLLLSVLILFSAGVLTSLAWDPYPLTKRGFDRQVNGIWLGHKWYTGKNVRTDQPVQLADLHIMKENLARHGIRDLFVHVGPVLPDGNIRDRPGTILAHLRRSVPNGRLLAWLGARLDTIPLNEARFRKAVISTLMDLRRQGFDGVHFDLEPVPDGKIDYLTLLAEVRQALGPDFIISHATPRAGPMGISIGPLRRSFWSKDFYRATMLLTDQTVVMAYESGLDFRKGYVAFVRHQTRLLARLGCAIPGHEVLIGIPSYEDKPFYSKREIENIRTASLGVRAGLESLSIPTECLKGVAIYANWVTDKKEWQDFRHHWMREIQGSPQ